MKIFFSFSHLLPGTLIESTTKLLTVSVIDDFSQDELDGLENARLAGCRWLLETMGSTAAKNGMVSSTSGKNEGVEEGRGNVLTKLATRPEFVAESVANLYIETTKGSGKESPRVIDMMGALLQHVTDGERGGGEGGGETTSTAFVSSEIAAVRLLLW